jgi:hypothetical protein
MPRRPFRRAVAASVLLHAALVVTVAVCWKSRPARPPAIDTSTDARITMRFFDEPAVEVAVAPAPPPPKAAPPVEAKRAEEPPTGSRPSVPPPTPRPLPPELLALLKRPAPVGGEVVDVDVTPAAMSTPAASPPAAPASPSPARPIHGPLPPAKSIVYVLDASGSMGEWGKLALARKALLDTLRAQPAGARFQVVVYNGSARALVRNANGGCVVVSADTVREVEEKLAGVEPVGRSDHAAGLRTALNLRPDFVLILTDADDLSAAKLRDVVKQAARPATVCVSAVTADGVGTPREWK